jgi:hypothetical protein
MLRKLGSPGPLAEAVVLVARGHDGAGARLRARQEPVLNLLFHSSEAIVGGSPYNRTQAELDAFCDRLERFFEFATGDARDPACHVRGVPGRIRGVRRGLKRPPYRYALMRILHVTPHLPPDQAANALLPWQLGQWAAEAGDDVAFAAHPPRAGGSAPLPGTVRWIPRRTGGVLDRGLRLGSLAAAWRIWRAIGPLIDGRHRPRSQQRAAGGGGRAARRGALANPSS